MNLMNSRSRCCLALLAVVVAATTAACSDPAAPKVVTSSPGTATVGVKRVDAALMKAYRAAKRDAAADGVTLRITSDWRSRAYQERLLEAAVAKYGSRREATRWVADPDSSAHVTGKALDIGPTDAADWVGRHGADYGLCQRFANEMWHFELLTTPGGTCPPMLPDGSSAR